MYAPINIEHSAQNFVEALAPEYQREREIAEIKKILGEDVKITATEEGYLVQIESGEVRVRVETLPFENEHFCGPKKFRLIFEYVYRL